MEAAVMAVSTVAKAVIGVVPYKEFGCTRLCGSQCAFKQMSARCNYCDAMLCLSWVHLVINFSSGK